MTQIAHYTSLRAFKSIIENCQLWATNIQYMNDPMEFVHGLKLIREVLHPQSILTYGNRPRPAQGWFDQLTQQLDRFEQHHLNHTFVLCFSKEIDLLSQWSAYCPNRDGYCLVYDDSAVRQAAHDVYRHRCHLIDCQYINNNTDTTTLQSMMEVLDVFYFTKYMNATTDADKSELLSRTRDFLIAIASRRKQESWRAESEIRLIVTLDVEDEHKIRFREGRNMLVPYIAVSISSDCIRDVIVGPTPYEELALTSTKSFLWSKCQQIPAARSSTVRYRPPL